MSRRRALIATIPPISGGVPAMLSVVLRLLAEQGIDSEVAWYEPKDGGVHNVWVQGDTLLLGDYQGGLRVVDISGELKGDLLAQGREMAHVHTGDAQGYVPHAAMAWGAFYQNGVIWVPDIFSGLWGIRMLPKKTGPIL